MTGDEHPFDDFITVGQKLPCGLYIELLRSILRYSTSTE